MTENELREMAFRIYLHLQATRFGAPAEMAKEAWDLARIFVDAENNRY